MENRWGHVVSFSAGVALHYAVSRGGRDGTPYGDLQLRPPRIAPDSADIDERDLHYTSIFKASASRTFSERLAAFHSIPVSKVWTAERTASLLTAAFLRDQEQYFAVPQYAEVVGNVLLPMFMDAAEEDLTRMCVMASDRVTITFYCPAATDTDADASEAVMRSAFVLANRLVRECDPHGERYTAHVFLNDLPKVFDPELGAPVGTGSFINSGCAPAPRTVFVFRREEMMKVLCHELIHSLKADCHGQSGWMAGMLSATGISVGSAFNPAEAVTEAVARIRYTTHVATESGRDVQTLLGMQLHHSLRGAAALLHMNGMERCGDLEEVSVVQSTYAFEYFVLSSALLHEAARDRAFCDFLCARLTPKPSVSQTALALSCCRAMRAALRPASQFREALDVVLSTATFTSSLRMTL